MSDEAVGQRELSAESTADQFTDAENALILSQAQGLVLDVVKASGTQTLNAALGELSQNAAAGLSESA